MQVRSAFLTTFAFLLAATVSYAQPSHPKSPHDTVRTKDITITYGRPYKKGREIFGKLVPYGQVYRLGADEATTITFAKDALFGGKPVKAGTYALFAIPNETTWTFILNSQPNQWGLDHDKNKDKDVLQVEEAATKLPAAVEQLTIKATPKAITVEWDKTKVMVPVQVK